ncbi:MAG: hypothetical protein PCFJNLEI_04230 [Verrucomicrobiae bacterium]|nr:hypothetical protein [Verrucomicrobiae bacterium]
MNVPPSLTVTVAVPTALLALDTTVTPERTSKPPTKPVLLPKIVKVPVLALVVELVTISVLLALTVRFENSTCIAPPGPVLENTSVPSLETIPVTKR